MRLFYMSLTISLIGYLGTWLIFANVLGIKLSPALLIFIAWLIVPYLPCVLGAWLVRSQTLPGIFAVFACTGTAARGLSIPMAMMSQRRDAQDGLVLIFLPIYQLPVTGLLLLVTAIVAARWWKPVLPPAPQALTAAETDPQ
jgi:hypothetical protein